MSDFERAYRESMEARIRQLEAELARLREENASLVDRHNRESHGTASHEAMAYDQLRAENARLRDRERELSDKVKLAQDVALAWADGDNDAMQAALLGLFLRIYGQAPRNALKSWKERAEKAETELIRLREALEKILKNIPGQTAGEMRRIARNALKETT